MKTWSTSERKHFSKTEVFYSQITEEKLQECYTGFPVQSGMWEHADKTRSIFTFGFLSQIFQYSSTLESWVVGFFPLNVVVNLKAGPRGRLPAQSHEVRQSQSSEIFHL